MFYKMVRFLIWKACLKKGKKINLILWSPNNNKQMICVILNKDCPFQSPALCSKPRKTKSCDFSKL